MKTHPAWQLERGNVGSTHPLFIVPDDGDGCRLWNDEATRMAASAPELINSLRRIANEAQGFLAMADREAHGNTNIQVLALRIKEAFEAISKAEAAD